MASPLSKSEQSNLYNNSYLGLEPAPEYTVPESVVASVYRNLFLNVGEGQVVDKFAKNKDIVDPIQNRLQFLSEKHNIEIKDFLEIPPPKRSYLDKENYYGWQPLIPDMGVIVAPVRPSGSNPWNPGRMFTKVISFASNNEEELSSLLEKSLGIFNISKEEDPVAQLLNNIFSNLSEQQKSADEIELDKNYEIAKLANQVNAERFPAFLLRTDLRVLKGIKERVSLRQWVSIIESYFRILLTSHARWVMHANITVWNALREKLDENGDPINIIEKTYNGLKGFDINERLTPQIRSEIADYIYARIGINLALEHFPPSKKEFRSPHDFKDWIEQLEFNSGKKEEFDIAYEEITHEEINKINSKSGLGRNIHFFVKHLLGQRQVIHEKDKNYDQGYWTIKTGNYNAAPWIFKTGPVATLLLSALSITGKYGSAVDISKTLSRFGWNINPDALALSNMGDAFNKLGITLDSPDGERGIIIKNPFSD